MIKKIPKHRCLDCAFDPKPPTRYGVGIIGMAGMRMVMIGADLKPIIEVPPEQNDICSECRVDLLEKAVKEIKEKGL